MNSPPPPPRGVQGLAGIYGKPLGWFSVPLFGMLISDPSISILFFTHCIHGQTNLKEAVFSIREHKEFGEEVELDSLFLLPN